MSTTRIRVLVGALVVLAAVLVVSVTSGGDSTRADAGVDRAFTADMIPHHDSAVEMARVAEERSRRPEIQGLAENIVRSQSDEIGQMRGIDSRLAADGATKGDLGASDDMMGMSMSAGSLKTADPFDRAFIDMMIPHHQGAIRMARIEFEKGSDAETKKLAAAIIAAQAKEIRQMNGWRTDWFGAASPAGGVPGA